MWIRTSHALAPLASLTSKSKTKWSWGPQQQATFEMAKKVIAWEVMLAHPDFSEPFVIHTDASQCQLEAVTLQDGKPVALCSRKLNPTQTRCATTEKELETLKECGNILLGQQMKSSLTTRTWSTRHSMLSAS